MYLSRIFDRMGIGSLRIQLLLRARFHLLKKHHFPLLPQLLLRMEEAFACFRLKEFAHQEIPDALLANTLRQVSDIPADSVPENLPLPDRMSRLFLRKQELLPLRYSDLS